MQICYATVVFAFEDKYLVRSSQYSNGATLLVKQVNGAIHLCKMSTDRMEC